MRRTTIALVAAAALPLGLAACSSDDDSTDAGDSGNSASEAPQEEPTADQDADADADGGMDTAAEPFGPACSGVPADGAGSFDGMAQDPVATAASNNPALSTLVAAVTAAGLGDTLNTAEALTVFAPVDDAFAAVPEEDLTALLADEAALTDVLTYHVVGERLSPEQLTDGEFETLQGGTLTTAGEGESFEVNGEAAVVCGNVRTANATVYLIDSVLMP
ncbi:fasciclin domain-containing protein [Streptomyces hainanensis]|uniref:Fasciclin domain-containing protein n=2 Tax=Streptomyces hainanensis TaxID=402648 RepID=A0A4R4SHC9_9ACTN|nr:fasciclin domain-containing protein [Streptomyces hainanensis]